MNRTSELHESIRNESLDDDCSSQSELSEDFLQLFLRDQFRVLACIVLIYDPAAASDVFQETSLVLWSAFPRFVVTPILLHGPWESHDIRY